MASPAAIAIAAHPDDIEFYMAGTLLLLREAGYETHYINLASGNCGSSQHNGVKTRSTREAEARQAASVLGAQFHRSLTNDLEILYDVPLLRRLNAVIREVRPSIVLTHSPQDYMEDHTTTARLAVTATFARGMPNFHSNPRRPAIESDVAIYHGMPHGLCDQLRRRIVPETFVDTASVHETKREALACHRSQQNWLEVSQGLNSYLQTMDDMSLQVGRMSKRFKHAEAWRRHLHLGFSATDIDSLRAALGRRCWINPAYAQYLKKGL